MPKIVVDATRLYSNLVFLKLPEEVRDALEDHEKDSTALFSLSATSTWIGWGWGGGSGDEWSMTYRS